MQISVDRGLPALFFHILTQYIKKGKSPRHEFFNKKAIPHPLRLRRIGYVSLKRGRRYGAGVGAFGNGGVYRGAGMVRGGNPGADRRGVAAAACGPADPNAPPHPPVLSGTGRGVSALLPAAAAPHGGGGISGGPGGQPAPALSAGGADVLRHLQRRGLLEPLYPVLGADGERPAPAAPPG